MEVFEEVMNNREEQHVHTDFIMMLLMLVLSYNVFVFDGILFLKIFGVVKGSRVAPRFVCLFMGWLETRLFQCWRALGKIPQVEEIDTLMTSSSFGEGLRKNFLSLLIS